MQYIKYNKVIKAVPTKNASNIYSDKDLFFFILLCFLELMETFDSIENIFLAGSNASELIIDIDVKMTLCKQTLNNILHIDKIDG